jgi:aminoglycoside 6'-N-acetyltransferase
MLTLRHATVDDAPLLRRWDDEPHVVASDPSSDWQWETELAEEWSWRDQLGAEADGVPIGFLQIIDPAEEVSRYWGDVPANLRAIDIWIGEAAYLGRGYGTGMMRWAIDFCFADPAVEAILIDPLAGGGGPWLGRLVGCGPPPPPNAGGHPRLMGTLQSPRYRRSGLR